MRWRVRIGGKQAENEEVEIEEGVKKEKAEEKM